MLWTVPWVAILDEGGFCQLSIFARAVDEDGRFERSRKSYRVARVRDLSRNCLVDCCCNACALPVEPYLFVVQTTKILDSLEDETTTTTTRKMPIAQPANNRGGVGDMAGPDVRESNDLEKRSAGCFHFHSLLSLPWLFLLLLFAI